MKKIVFILILVSSLALNTFPQTQFRKLIGGFSEDVAESMIQTSDGGYIMAGSTDSFGSGIGDICLIKTNSIGDTLWSRVYGGSQDDAISCIQQTQDGSYIITGETISFGIGNGDHRTVDRCSCTLMQNSTQFHGR